MDSWPTKIKFRKTWRAYQARVLSELQEHLDDNHLHVIAAPGSGKTVLGLEAAHRLNKATLVFCPTLAIRDQWVERLVGLFLEESSVPEWISRDIKRPGFFTVSTYQGLHSAYTGKAEEEQLEHEEQVNEEKNSGSNPNEEAVVGREGLVRKLREIGVGTLVLDEAHHLRNEWWKCLIDVKKRLDNPTVVALTATPPFDVSPFEWERYIGLCGSVDSEICVPELVLARNLCPHQDYVYMSEPLRSERAEIRDFRSQIDIRQPNVYVEEILSDPGFYSSIAFFLNHVRGRPPKKLFHVIGFPVRKCPKLNLEHLEVLLQGCLYVHRRTFGNCEEVFERTSRYLKRIGAIERRQVGLRSTSRITRLLVSSASKLESIKDIVKIESESMSLDLRLVILTDYIRRSDFPRDGNDFKPLKRLGVVPIFEMIRRSDCKNIKLGILSGSLVVIPCEAKWLISSAPS
ncbi:MAG: DEAD/DEAH box helicase [Planctomycetota bacterium]